MTPEAVTAIASVLTTLVIGATAVAAVVQLRHMRAGNAIEAILSFRSMLDDEEHRRATNLLRGGALNRALADPGFRRYVYRISKRLPPGDVPAEFPELHQAAIAIGNGFELIGGMVRNHVVPTHMFLQNYWWVVDNSWTMMQRYVALMREYSGSDGLFEDFEYLTVASRKWAQQHPNSYAPGVARIANANIYPLAQESWLLEPE